MSRKGDDAHTTLLLTERRYECAPEGVWERASSSVA